MEFRPATPDEAVHIAALVNTAFRSEKTGQTWLYDEQEYRIDIVSSDVISALIKGTDTVMLVGTLAKGIKPVACCYLRSPSAPSQSHITEGAAWLGLLAVEVAYHGQGFGFAMLQAAEKYVLGEWHVRRLELDFVSTRLELRAWYERCGYVATGKTRPFLYPELYGENARRILVPGLAQIVLGKDL